MYPFLQTSSQIFLNNLSHLEMRYIEKYATHLFALYEFANETNGSIVQNIPRGS